MLRHRLSGIVRHLHRRRQRRHRTVDHQRLGAHHHVKLFLGEFGVSQRSACVAALDRARKVIEDNTDVGYGYSYWAAGAWWGNSMFNMEIGGGTPQGAVLKRHGASFSPP